MPAKMGDTFVNLPLDRSQIDPNFEGYKLSLDKIPIYEHRLESCVSPCTLQDDQYSYQHIKAFGAQNQLYPDSFAGAVYVVDTRGKVVKVSFENPRNAITSASVLAMPTPLSERSSKHSVAASLHFPAEEWAVLADGQGSYHIVHTHNRQNDHNWQVKFSGTLDNEGTAFSILHSTYHTDDAPVIEAAFLTVTKNEEVEEEEGKTRNGAEREMGEEGGEGEEKEEGGEERMEMGEGDHSVPVTKSAFITTIHWITLTSDSEGGLKVSRRRKLSAPAAPDYVCVEEGGGAIIIASEKPYKFTYDSEKPVEAEKKEEKWVMVDKETSSTPPPQYTWSQTMQDVSVTFTLPPDTAKVDVLYKLSPDRLEVGVKNGEKLLCGHLHAPVDPEGSTWTMDSATRRLTVELSKQEEQLWPVVVLGDNRGEMTLDPAQVEEIHQRLAHLTSDQWNPDPNKDGAPPFNAQQLEDCDIFPDDNSLLARFHGDTHLPTHQVNLGGNHHLFTSPMRPPALCLRHDVDGVLWQPLPPSSSSSSSPSSAPSSAPFRHLATFPALGFVAASKQERRFSVCSVDGSSGFAALVDCSRRVYLYRRPAPASTPLRHRRRPGPALEHVARQQLVTLASSAAVLGAAATATRVVLLTAEGVVYVLGVVTEQEEC